MRSPFPGFMTLTLTLARAQYDPYGDYIRTWLPQLAEVPTNKIQCPWTLPPKDFARYIPQGSYPQKPVLEQSNWKPHYTRRGPSKHGVPNRNERVKNPGPLIVSGGAAKSNKNKGPQQQQQQQKEPKQEGKNKDKNQPAESTPRGSSDARERETKVIDEVVQHKGDDGQADPNGRDKCLS